MEDSLKQQFRGQLQEINTLLNSSVATLLVEEDFAALRDILEEIRSDYGITYLVVIDQTGKQVARAGWSVEQSIPFANNTAGLTGEIFRTNIPIILGNQHYGMLHYGVSTQFIKNSRNRLVWYGLILIVAALFLIFLSLSLIANWLTRNLFKLTHASEKFATGDLSSSVEIDSQDEIGSLAKSFNSMAKSINKQIKDIRHSEARYHSLFENNHCVMLIIDPDTGNIVDANPAACKFYGFSHDDLAGKKINEINRLSDKEIKREMINAKLEQRNHFYFRHKLKDGTIKDVEVYSGPINIFDKKLLYSIVHDISDKKIIEDSLRRSKKEWEKTFDAMVDIVTIQDKNMRIVRANKAAHQFFQVNYGELKGKYCYEVFCGTAEPCSGCPLSHTIQDINSHSEIMTHENLGKIFYVSSAAVCDANGEMQYLVHTAKDITKQKKLEEELFQAHKMEAIGTLAGGIAHDFNNILSAIIGFSELALLDIPADNNATKDIGQVLKSSRRAADLVQQILTFSRKTDHRLAPIAPHLIIKEALKMLRSSLPVTIDIQEDIDSECGKIMADPTNIHQIIVNLCTNSLHAMENEKGILRVSLQRKEISAGEITGEPGVSPGSFIVLEVSDTGHGIDQSMIERIFEPYFTTKEVGKGTGLGLAVIHGIIQDCHGFIRVKSELGKGTTFYVHIPELQQEISTTNETKTNEPLPTGTERILVVDDENLIVNMNKTVLERLGYKVSATTESLDALKQIRTDPNQFDLIITDQTMPNLTGAELAQEILKIKRDIPIILCTGYSSVLSEEDALAIGIKKYARKPVDRTTLAKTVRQVLDDK